MKFAALLQHRIDSRIGYCLAKETFRPEARACCPTTEKQKGNPRRTVA